MRGAKPPQLVRRQSARQVGGMRGAKPPQLVRQQARQVGGMRGAKPPQPWACAHTFSSQARLVGGMRGAKPPHPERRQQSQRQGRPVCHERPRWPSSCVPSFSQSRCRRWPWVSSPSPSWEAHCAS